MGSVGDVIFNMALALPWEECISRTDYSIAITHTLPLMSGDLDGELQA